MSRKWQFVRRSDECNIRDPNIRDHPVLQVALGLSGQGSVNVSNKEVGASISQNDLTLEPDLYPPQIPSASSAPVLGPTDG